MHRERPRTGQLAGLFFELREAPKASSQMDVPLLLLPGLLSDGRQLSRLCRLLQRRVLVVDPLGCGHSEAPSDPAAYTFAAQTARLLALLGELALPVVDLAGFSMGGMWAQHALLTSPQRFRHACLVATAPSTDPRLRCIVRGLIAQHRAGVSQLDLFRTLQVMCLSAQFLDHPSIIPMLEVLWEGQNHPTTAVSGQLNALLSHDEQERLPQLTSVRAVIAGADDFLMPPLVQRRLAALVHQPAPELIASAGHALWVECPDRLATALNQALPVSR